MCHGEKVLSVTNITIVGRFYVSFSDQNSESQRAKSTVLGTTQLHVCPHCYMGRAAQPSPLWSPNPALWDILGSIRQGAFFTRDRIQPRLHRQPFLTRKT